ncbi:5-(carboxyamino)imidazole ribonucleotide synthase [Corynebacterium hadale]|uniref:5-(carboxyamino)imidazole ribonucleotide synthase n=1 Tax=Corynebacterium hadale TaxID=2026255 RepID=UPI000BAA8D99|nr:5-(carboxyamino)imidazole ribonucleotide synthase [Corynebacterium hadale]
MPTVVVVGDGQLARMMHTEAIELGLHTRLLAGSEDSSAAQVFGDVRIGDYTNLEDLQEVAHGAAAVTFDHEHVPNEHLEQLIDANVVVEPRPEALIYAQDKLEQRRELESLGVPVPDYAPIDSVEAATSFWQRHEHRVCLKTTRGGYDGKGVWFPDSLDEFVELVGDMLGQDIVLYAEEKVDFVRELSAMVARTRSGEMRVWPVVESRQTDGICHVAIAPAPDLSTQLARECQNLAKLIARKLDVTGVMAVELFEYETETGTAVSVNELAMRPHNTGHWTQDGCLTSQFEQHMRAVLDFPLGETETVAPVTVMVNVLGGEEDPEMPMERRVKEVMLRYPEAKVHLYGKDWRPGRKIGHVNVTGYDVVSTRKLAEHAAQFLVTASWT